MFPVIISDPIRFFFSDIPGTIFSCHGGRDLLELEAGISFALPVCHHTPNGNKCWHILVSTISVQSDRKPESVDTEQPRQKLFAEIFTWTNQTVTIPVSIPLLSTLVRRQISAWLHVITKQWGDSFLATSS